jgi:hypothetical protein
MKSIVGIGTSNPPPYSFGNYFGLSCGLRVLNFWAENLQAAQPLFLQDGLVQIRVWTWHDDTGRERKVAVIHDPRIPGDWYHNKLCFTGFGRPPVEVAREIYELLGDPGNEMEYYSDPDMYYARRGQRLMGSCVSWNAPETAEQLVAELEAKRKEQ